MTEHNLESEFFTKVKGWWKCNLPPGGWAKNDGVWSNWTEHLPTISTSWDAFHEWVVPELMRHGNYGTTVQVLNYKSSVMLRIGHFFCDTDIKTPQRALEWALEELQS